MASRDIYEHGFDESAGQTIADTDCPECSGSIASEGGEIACTECGIILNEYHLDHSASPRTFPDDEESRERTGAPLTVARHDRGLSTEIGSRVDGTGKQLSRKKRRHLGRLRREHTRGKWRSKAERNLAHACQEIARLTSALCLSRDIRKDGALVYRRAQSANLIRGRSIEAIATAAVYVACRRRERPHTLDELARVAQCSPEALRNAYGVLNRELDLAVRPRTPATFVPKVAADLDIDEPVIRAARRLATSVSERGITGGSHPAGVAAGCLAVVSAARNVDIAQCDLADAADVSTATVRGKRNSIRAACESGDLTLPEDEQ